jgi:hypothetical protein
MHSTAFPSPQDYTRNGKRKIKHKHEERIPFDAASNIVRTQTGRTSINFTAEYSLHRLRYIFPLNIHINETGKRKLSKVKKRKYRVLCLPRKKIDNVFRNHLG